MLRTYVEFERDGLTLPPIEVRDEKRIGVDCVINRIDRWRIFVQEIEKVGKKLIVGDRSYQKGWHYPSGEILIVKELKKQNKPDISFIVPYFEVNGWEKVVRTPQDKWFHFTEDDIIEEKPSVPKVEYERLNQLLTEKF